MADIFIQDDFKCEIYFIFNFKFQAVLLLLLLGWVFLPVYLTSGVSFFFFLTKLQFLPFYKKKCKWKRYLSYDVAVFQWITSCHKNRMTTRVITLLREYVTSLTTSVTTMLIFIGNMSTFRGDKIVFKKSYDKTNLTLVVISYEIY